MSIMVPKIEVVDRSLRSIRYLEHGWPTDLCRWHAHEEYELHLIVGTRGKAFVGDYIGEFEPGYLYLTGPNLPHNWVTDELFEEALPLRDMLVQFSHDSIEKLAIGFPEFSQVRNMLMSAKSGILFEGFNATFARGHMESIRDHEGPERILAFIRFLVRLNEHAEKRELSVAKLFQPAGGSKHGRIGLVVDHIVQHFKEDLSVAQAAKMANMTVATFSRSFQSVTGHRFVEFVNSVRIGKACGLLYATDDKVMSICHQTGFHNIANFNRQFLKLKGMTPTIYRETARKGLVSETETTV
ncbi:AraC family transcriptional regulator [uncultured Litoreibacter sp.]|uniref:AraC family transcriptional regulator n=1 Tax=uncultured Litoreibacter sp. TaxID=1392394 RepID=UPI0026141C18|nr:AraC family transcriptional regulator [uncultured Litoreibacter sp.]